MSDIFSYDDARDRGDPASSRLPLYLGYQAWVNQLRYPAVLSAFWHGQQLYNPSYAMAMDADAYEVLLRDAVVRQCADIRYRAVAGRQWRVVPGDDSDAAKKLAGIVEAALRGISRFAEARYELARAVLIGTSYAYVCGRRAPKMLDGEFANWWCPYRLDDIDSRRMRWAVKPASGTETRAEPVLEMWAINEQKWVEVPKHAPIIRSVYNDEESRLGSGRGLFDACYQLVWSKNETAQLLAETIAMHGRGILIGKIDPAALGSKNTAARQTAMQDALEKMRRSNIGTMDKRDEIELLTGGDAGANHALEFIRYCDDRLTSLLLGSSLPYGGNSGGDGSRARAETEKDVSTSIVQSDQDKQSEDLTAGLIVGCFIRHNQQPLARLGLANVAAPKFSVVPEEKVDPLKRLQIAQGLQQMGAGIREDELYQGTGYTAPAPGDKVIGAPQQQQPQQQTPLFADRNGKHAAAAIAIQS